MSAVTVVITTHNREDYLKKCIDSILLQSYKNFSIIVISDGKFSDTNDLIESFANKNITLISNNHTGLPAVSRNIGIELASTEYICFCDDDDVWYSDKLADQMNIMKQKNATLVSSFADYIDSYGNVIFNNPGVIFNYYNLFLRLNKYFLYVKNYICLSSIMIRTDIAKKVLFNESIDFRGSEDYLFILNVLQLKQNFELIKKVHVGYRIHNNNLSSNLLSGYLRSIQILKIT